MNLCSVCVKETERKGKFLRVEGQLIKVQGVTELRNYHLATSMGNNLSETDRKNGIDLAMKYLSTRYSLITKRKLTTLCEES